MSIVPIMWIVWCIFVVVTAALYVYRMSLTRDEENQIFLDDSFEQEKTTQASIVSRIAKVEPYVKAGSWLVAASSAFVIGYYVVDIVNKLR